MVEVRNAVWGGGRKWALILKINDFYFAPQNWIWHPYISHPNIELISYPNPLCRFLKLTAFFCQFGFCCKSCDLSLDDYFSSLATIAVTTMMKIY